MANLLIHAKGTLDEYLSKQILGECGIATVPEKAVQSVAEALEAAKEFGFPVVLKGLIRDVLHKSEQGLVQVNLRNEADIREAFSVLSARIGNQDTLVLQKQIGGKCELIAGVVRDPQFGVCVMAGIGGILAEAMDDKIFLVAPFDVRQALYMLRQLRSRKLLDGFRGEAPLDREAFARILVRLGHLALAHPTIRELDINPLIVSDGKPIAVDANIVLSASP
jgi:acetyltransferase